MWIMVSCYIRHLDRLDDFYNSTCKWRMLDRSAFQYSASYQPYLLPGQICGRLRTGEEEEIFHGYVAHTGLGLSPAEVSGDDRDEMRIKIRKKLVCDKVVYATGRDVIGEIKAVLYTTLQ